MFLVVGNGTSWCERRPTAPPETTSIDHQDKEQHSPTRRHHRGIATGPGTPHKGNRTGFDTAGEVPGAAEEAPWTLDPPPGSSQERLGKPLNHYSTNKSKRVNVHP